MNPRQMRRREGGMATFHVVSSIVGLAFLQNCGVPQPKNIPFPILFALGYWTVRPTVPVAVVFPEVPVTVMV